MYKYNRLISSLCLCLLVLLMNGCGPEDVTPKIISELLFKDVQRVRYMKEFPQLSELNKEEIQILKTAIYNGTDLVCLSNDSMPNGFQSGYLYFKINKPLISADLFYNKNDGFMLIEKNEVHGENRRKYELRPSLFKKYLVGVYRLRPSKEISKLVNE